MGFDLTAEQQMLSDAIRTFVDRECVPHEDLVEQTRQVPPDLIEQIRSRSIAAGYYALNMPAEHGGGGLGHYERAVTEFQFGRTIRALQMICNRPAPILKACRDDQIETYLKPKIGRAHV